MERTPNSFNAMRLTAALTVLVSHAWPLTGIADLEPVWHATGHQATLGRLAVAAFFIMSGCLITQSWQRKPDPVRFIQARAMRLLPGLAAVLILLACVAGPLLTTLPLLDYAASGAVPRFVLSNLAMQYTAELPGVFGANPFPGAVDDSLWTLKYEAE